MFHRPGEPLKSQMPSWSWAATLRGVYYESKILDQDFDDLKPGLIFKSKLAKCPKVEHARLSIASKAALSKCQACYNLPR